MCEIKTFKWKKQQRNGEKIDIIIVDQKGAYFHISLSMILHHVWN